MTRKQERLYRGLPVSAGLVHGKVRVHRAYVPDWHEAAIEPGQVAAEVRRFRQAVRAAEKELRSLHAQVQRDMGEEFADFISVHIVLLTDQEVISGTEEFIRERRRNAELAYTETLTKLAAPVARSAVPLFKERAMDVSDVSNRVLRHLLGDEGISLLEVDPGTVLVARDLPPSDTVLLDPRRIAGLVLESGGKTSHTAIMAKAKEIPAVMDCRHICDAVQDGQPIFVDGYRGLAIVNPTANRLRAYDAEMELRRRHRRYLVKLVEQEPVTLDGKHIDLSANIEFMSEARAALKYGGRGVGLFRTEYMYLAKRRLPNEDEQFQVYADAARSFKPYPVIIRTFDLGGDKVLPGYKEANPFLGYRAIRLCLDNLEMFNIQLRAILRASAFGNVKVMFPMVSTVEELRRAKLAVEKAKVELKGEGLAYDEQFQVGVMVEIPSAAILADRLARECSFLSIGSNDLTQYTLAVDRGNEHVARLYDHFHPAVLHLFKKTIDSAHQQGIWVGMCGEFGSDPLGVMTLLGMGIDEISVVPSLIPEMKNTIRSIDTESAAEVVAAALKQSTALEVQRLLRREMDRRFPKLAESIFELKGGGDGAK